MRFVSAFSGALALTALLAAPARADDKAAEVLAAARAALGGQKVENVRTLSAKGDFRRMIGQREMNGEMSVELMAPDRLKRTEDMGIPGGPNFSRTVALNGGEFWEDATNRGGGVMRFGGPAGPGAPGGQGPTEADRERFRQMQQRRLEGDLRRYLLAWLARTETPATYVGEAEADDGRADVIEVKPEDGAAMRLFLDQRTHLPLMLTYEGVLPRFNMRRGAPSAGGGPGAQAAPGSDAPQASVAVPQGSATGTAANADDARRRMEPPQHVTFEVRYEDYKSVNGVMLPHLITQSVNGRPTEEWTISEYKVNPTFKPDTFTKK
jgi:hypothetical protein